MIARGAADASAKSYEAVRWSLGRATDVHGSVCDANRSWDDFHPQDRARGGQTALPRRPSVAPMSIVDPVRFSRAPDGLFQLDAEQWLPWPVERVFAFFADAGNLAAIMPAALRLRVVAPCPDEMRAGAVIDCRLRVRGLPIRWCTRIAVWDPPRLFVDEQVRGPYRVWVHEHRFEPQSRGGVAGALVRDVVRYCLMCSSIAQPLFVRRDLHAVFRHRHAKLAARFGAPS